MARRRAWVALAAALAVALGGCSDVPGQRPPRCEANSRLAIIAQSVPGAAYVPCIAGLPAGWSFVSLRVEDGGATMTLESDRADRDIEIELVPSCDITDATPIAPSDEGVRTYHFVESIDPRYRGRLLDVFPGGCVVSTYDFERGPHVALVTELQDTLGLYSRRELRQGLEAEFGITLDP